MLGFLIALLILLPVETPSERPPLSSGVIFGEADCVYRLSAIPGAPGPPAVVLRGFRQRAAQRGQEWEISIHTRAAPVGGGYSFDAHLAQTALAGLPEVFRAAAMASLKNVTSADGACLQIARLLREHLAYVPLREDESADPAALLQKGTASCAGFARIAALLLQCGNVSCQPVVGLRAPSDGGPLLLKGGALHVWLEVHASDAPPAYYDPAFSAGWVPARYVVLRTGDGFQAGTLGAWKGAILLRLWQRDRLFAVPAKEGETLFWRGGEPPIAPNSALLCGKLLEGGDGPLAGSAILRGAELSLAVPLWEGNFCFQDLLPGEYDLSVISETRTCAHESISLTAMDKKTVVFYSQGARRSSAVNGTGR